MLLAPDFWADPDAYLADDLRRFPPPDETAERS